MFCGWPGRLDEETHLQSCSGAISAVHFFPFFLNFFELEIDPRRFTLRTRSRLFGGYFTERRNGETPNSPWICRSFSTNFLFIFHEFSVHFSRMFCSFFTNFLFIFHEFCVHFSWIFCLFSIPDNPSTVARKHAFVPPTLWRCTERSALVTRCWPREYALTQAGVNTTRTSPEQGPCINHQSGCYMVQSCLIETLGKTDVDS